MARTASTQQFTHECSFFYITFQRHDEGKYNGSNLHTSMRPHSRVSTSLLLGRTKDLPSAATPQSSPQLNVDRAQAATLSASPGSTLLVLHQVIQL